MSLAVQQQQLEAEKESLLHNSGLVQEVSYCPLGVWEMQ